MSTTGPFADTGVNMGGDNDFPGYGWLYLCFKCVGLLGAVAGMATVEAVEAMQARIAELTQEVADAQDSRDEALRGRVIRLEDAEAHGLIIVGERPEAPAPQAA